MRVHVCSCVSCGVKVIVTQACAATAAVKRERSLTGHRSKEELPHFSSGVGVEGGFLESEYLYCGGFSSQRGRGGVGSAEPSGADLIQHSGMTPPI